MFYRARSYAPYLPRHRRLSAVGSAVVRDATGGDLGTLAACQCRAGERICPRHAPNLYTLGGAAHRAAGPG